MNSPLRFHILALLIDASKSRVALTLKLLGLEKSDNITQEKVRLAIYPVIRAIEKAEKKLITISKKYEKSNKRSNARRSI